VIFSKIFFDHWQLVPYRCSKPSIFDQNGNGDFRVVLGAKATKSSDPLAELFFSVNLGKVFSRSSFTGNIIPSTRSVLAFQDYKHQISHGSWV
jgi:hypothetical protein